jgi:hypothetical protein
MQAECLLSITHKSGQVCPVVDGQTAFFEDDLGGALDEFLRAADGESRVVKDGALDAAELLADSRRVADVLE